MLKHLFMAIALTGLLSGCGSSSSPNIDAAQSDAHEFERGAHNGRLLRDGDFAIEISIFETGTPPEFRVYVTQHGKPADLNAVKLAITLARFGGITDQHHFAAKSDYLVSPLEVYEPHSFDVTVQADYRQQQHRWTYPSHEGRTTITAAMATASGVETRAVAPGSIEQTLSLYGAIQPDPTRTRAVTARFAGVIRQVAVDLGAQVSAGQILARVESNESLQTYEVTAPIAGIVVQRRANAGEIAGAEPLFEIADYSQVWATLNIFPRDRAQIKIGQTVTVHAADGNAKSIGTIAAIASDPHSPSTMNARVLLDNRDGQWTPGQFINAEAVLATTDAALVIPIAAVQTFRDWNVVFLNDGETYQAQPVELGQRDGENIEVISGVKAGMRVVVNNSYLVKADIEKSGASHDH